MPAGPAAPAGCRFGVPAPPEEGTVCPDGSPPRDRLAEERLRDIIGLDEEGEAHPIAAYDIGCDEGAWNHLVRKMWCGAQALPFALGKWAIGLGIQLMGWALEFRLADSLGPVAGLLSRIYDTSLVGPLGVRHLAWTMALFVGGWHLMRARAAQGIAEIATTFLVAAVGGIVLANPQGYLEGSVDLAQNTSGAVLEATSDILQPNGSEQETDADAVRARLGDILRQSFVAQPYDIINWGEQLEGECASARDEILQDGPWGSDDEPRDIMRDHGCDVEADYNAEPNDERAVASLIVGLAAVVATVLLLALALVVYVAQLTLVALFAGASLVWALALFPGAREVLWWWLGRLVWAVAATIAATFTLSWLAITVTAVLAETGDMSIIQRSLVALLVVAFAFRLRSHLGRMIDQASRRVGDRLSRVGGQGQNRAPGFAATTGAGAGGGTGGFGLSQMARSWSQDIPGGRPAWHLLYMYGYSRAFTRAMRHRGGHGYPGAVRGSIRRADTGGRRLTTGGLDAARGFGRAARAVAMAPIVGPQAYATTRVRATVASQRARARLTQAREQAHATRGQWAFNARHPVLAMQAAHQEAVRDAQRSGRLTARPRPPAPVGADRPETRAPRRQGVGWWWQVAGTPYQEHRLPFDRPGESYHQRTIYDELQSSERRPQPRPRPDPRHLPGRQERLDLPPSWYQPKLDPHGTEGTPRQSPRQSPPPGQEPRPQSPPPGQQPAHEDRGETGGGSDS